MNDDMSTLTSKKRNDLIEICKTKNIKGYSNKKKEELIELITEHSNKNTEVIPKKKKRTIEVSEKISYDVKRLNYIGSKYQLLEWIERAIKDKTGWSDFNGKIIADLFSGTGIVSYHFRNKGATTLSNDAELYSSIITHAFACSEYNIVCKEFIEKINKEIVENLYKDCFGFITKNYSPYEENERMFFTVDNAQRIDYIKSRIMDSKECLTENDYKFLLASLLLSADNVSNVPAVYGCYLKNFKTKATKQLILSPIHCLSELANLDSVVYNLDILSDDIKKNIKCDLVYLDPPYNERQYSKNYFPLNMIAFEGKMPELKGKTGIPDNCFSSSFCKKISVVEESFKELFATLDTKWIVLSYNSESIVPKDKLVELMEGYGEVSVIERDYKRFKSFDYNEDKPIKEYLFFLQKRGD